MDRKPLFFQSSTTTRQTAHSITSASTSSDSARPWMTPSTHQMDHRPSRRGTTAACCHQCGLHRIKQSHHRLPPFQALPYSRVVDTVNSTVGPLNCCLNQQPDGLYHANGLEPGLGCCHTSPVNVRKGFIRNGNTYHTQFHFWKTFFHHDLIQFGRKQ